jgi:hypothetical protein
MEKWGVYLYACWAALGTVVGIAMLGVFNLTALLVRIVVTAVSFYFICWRNRGHPEHLLSPREPGESAAVAIGRPRGLGR